MVSFEAATGTDEEALNHSADKTSLVPPKALLPLDDFGRDAVFFGESP
jgi:hypothetical protein